MAGLLGHAARRGRRRQQRLVARAGAERRRLVAPHFSLGSQLTLSRSTLRSQTSSTETGAALRPKIGWALPLGDGLTLWTRGFGWIGVTHAENRVGAGAGPIGAAGGSTTGIGWGLGAETMFVAGLGRSVAQTFGPEIAYGKHDPIGRDRPSASSGTAVSLGARGGISLVF